MSCTTAVSTASIRRWEWNPALLQVRGRLEDVFLSAVRADVGEIDPDRTAADEMEALSVEPVDGNGPSYYLRDTGTWEQMREYFVHRSLYHLKEADPHAWAIPRLTGQAKASFVAVEFDEYGGGRGARVHQQLFADLMDAAALDSAYLGYLDDVPAEALAVVNLMSLFGLHRELRGAAIGHFASTEITSPPGSRRLVQALERMEAPQPCIEFYREHVEADAVHEQVVRTEVVGDLLAREPHLERRRGLRDQGARRGRGSTRRSHDDVLGGRRAIATPTADLTARSVHDTDGWCRTTDNTCCADTCRWRP